MKVVTVVGVRPDIIRLSRVMPALDKVCTHIVIRTGQNSNYRLSRVFFKELGLRQPDLQITESTPGAMIEHLERLLQQVQPDALLILGDNNSSFAAAYAAKRLRIPVFHMEAGNRCFDERCPEEINRRLIDHMSDINMPYTDIAREYLLREGLAPDRIIKTGSPMLEVLDYYEPQIRRSQVLKRLHLDPHDYFLVSCHRAENVDSETQLQRFLAVLNELAAVYRQPVIVSTHPRTQKRLRDSGYGKMQPEVKFLKPFGFFDYVQLQMNARVTLSDSGTITEESSLLKFPALNLREAYERPEGMEEGSVMLTGFNVSRIHESIAILDKQERDTLDAPIDYLVRNVSEKVVRIILSHMDYVNRTVWRQYV
jgi:UDP-N-acetyl-L-fucosamine synthase